MQVVLDELYVSNVLYLVVEQWGAHVDAATQDGEGEHKDDIQILLSKYTRRWHVSWATLSCHNHSLSDWAAPLEAAVGAVALAGCDGRTREVASPGGGGCPDRDRLSLMLSGQGYGRLGPLATQNNAILYKDRPDFGSKIMLSWPYP